MDLLLSTIALNAAFELQLLKKKYLVIIQYLHFLNIVSKALLFFAVRPHYWEHIRMSLVYREELQEDVRQTMQERFEKHDRLHELIFGMSKEGSGRKS